MEARAGTVRARKPVAMRSLSTLLCSSLLIAGCAAGEGDPGEEVPLAVPTLDGLAPTEVVLGDEIKLLGSNFPDRRAATMSLRLSGVYHDAGGDDHDFDGEFPVVVDNPSVATFVMEDLWFSPGRDEIGTFSGTAELVVARPDAEGGGEVVSRPLEVDVRILPSIRIDRLRAVDRGCAEKTSSTTANTEIELRASALGIGEASASRPWRIKLSFLAPQIAVRYVVPGAYDFWPIDGPISDTISATAPDGASSLSFNLQAGRSVQLDPTRIEHRVKISPPVTIGQNLHDEVVVQRVATGPVAFLGHQYATFVVEMDPGDGRVLRRHVSLAVWNELEVGLWDGDERLLRRFSPEATSGCIPGGALGIDLSYTEGESISRSRSVGFRWDASAASSLGFNIGPSIAAQLNGNQNWSESFGVDVNESVSSEMHSSQNIQVRVLPSYYGVSYRQLEHLERDVDIRYHNVCGASGVVGQATLTNWNFGFDVATGDACPPPSNLPPAESFE
jgi:hypothetical protein